MESRLKLHALFEEILGSRSVYFNPPESVKMSYEAIVYKRKRIENVHANSSIYRQNNAYEVIVIHKDPDSETVGKISRLPMCTHDNQYVSDNLIHDAFTLYFN